MTCEKCGIGTMNGPRYFKKFMDGLPGVSVEGLRFYCSTCGYTRIESTKDCGKGPSDMKEFMEAFNKHTNVSGQGPTSPPPAVFTPGTKIKPQ